MAQHGVDALLNARLLNPQADDVWIALVQLLVDVGQPDKALPLIAAAEESLKGEQAAITLANCCELLKDTEKAQAKYEAAAKASPQNSRVLRQVAGFYLRNGKLDLAEPLLRQIIKLQTPATLTDTCWARHHLALLLKDHRDFDDLCQGMALIEENLNSKAATIEDKRLKAFFLLADPRREKIGDAIQAMEELVKGADVTPDDYFSLAKLYLKKGDWTNYEKRMHGVLGAQKGAVQPSYLVFYINSLLERKDLEDAHNWLQTLEKTAPDLFDTARLGAEYKFLRGNAAASAAEASGFYKAASDQARAFLDNPRAQPPGRAQQLLRVAQLMESFSDRLKAEGKQVAARAFAEKADNIFTSLRRISDTGDILFAAYLARQKRNRECLEVLEHCWDKYPPENLRIPASVMIRSKAADSAQYLQLEKILVAASSKSNQPAPLLPVLAELHARQGQYDKSITDYRAVLAKDPRNFQAMNNLGLALARTGQNLDDAIKLVNDALAITGPMAEVLDSRAIVHIARHEPEKALDDLAAVVKDDGTAEHYFHQAWAWSLAGKKTEATAAFSEAVKKGLNPSDLDPREVPVYDRLRDGL